MTAREPRWPYVLIWAVPVGAAVAASAYLGANFKSRGPVITIGFDDAAGIRTPDTRVVRRGVTIGRVTGVALVDDGRHARLTVRLESAQTAFAREGAAFWIVRPEITEAGLGGLNAVFSGPYVEAVPGTGAPASRFVGLESPPIPNEDGVSVVLRAPERENLQPGAPVVFRGVEVGVIREVKLSRAADAVEARATVWRRYAALVRTGSRFWTLSGVDVEGGLFKGVQVKLGSWRELLVGGIAFATPEKNMGPPAQDGAAFELADHPDKEWLRWRPRIAIAPLGVKPVEAGQRLPTGEDLMDRALHAR